MVDKAIRDCQSVTNRHPATSADDDNHAYDDFRLRPLNPRDIVTVQLPSGVHYRVPSKLASVGYTISVYAQNNKSDVPGEAHPGHSVDTRFGVIAKPQAHAIQEQIRRDTDRDRELGVRERDEEARKNKQRNLSIAQQQDLQHGSLRGIRQTRRGRRGPRDGASVEQFQQREPSSNGGTGGMRDNHQPMQTNNPRSFQVSNHQSLQVRNQEQNLGQYRPQHTIVPPETLREMEKYHPNNYGGQFLLLSPYLPPMGHVDYTGIRRQDEPKHLANQAMANAREAGLPGHYLNFIPHGYRSNSDDPTRYELLNDYYSQGLDRSWESEDEYLAAFYRNLHNQRLQQASPFEGVEMRGRVSSYNQRSAIRGADDFMRGGFISYDQPNASEDSQEGKQGWDISYTTPHRSTAHRANREYAKFLDELNREQPLADGHLQGDAFVGHPTLQPRVEVEPPSPARNVLAAIAEHRDRLKRAQSQHSIGSRPTSTEGSSQQSTLVNSAFNAGLGHSTASSDAGGISDDNAQRGRPSESARARAADERRAASGAQPGARGIQIDTAILAPSGIFSREPSQMPRRSSRLFDQSRRSSPGAPSHTQQRGRRSSSAGNFR